jgi:hypothetical protein
MILMHGFIDPPSPFAPRKAWEDFLTALAQLPDQDDPDVKAARLEAEKELADRKAKD